MEIISLKHDSQTAQSLVKDFYELVNMKTLIYDAQGRETFFYPTRYTPFCQYLRNNEEMDEACRMCDKKAIADCWRTQKSIIYTCHAGLTEGISPIIINNTIIGFIAIGQIKEKNAVLSISDVGDLDTLKQLFDELPTIDRKTIESAMHVLEACAAYEQLKTLVEENANDFATRLIQFIDGNLKENLDIDALMRKFHISRVELYKNVKFSFGCTPAELVKSRRLYYAAKLLQTTDMPVNKIAMLTNISDYNYFSKIFKKQYGITPTQYRTQKP